jgi:two-component system, NtrC family, response regulator AtoC
MSAEPTKVLVVDDDPGFRKALTLILGDAGYRVATAVDAREGLDRALREAPDVILTDVRMPGEDGLTLVRRLAEAGVRAPVLVMTAYGSMDLAVEALRIGAADYLAKPFGAPELLLALRKVEARRDAEGASPGVREPSGRAAAGGDGGPDPSNARFFGALLAASPAMIEVGETARKVAAHDTSVLVQGATGTGKELLARFLHSASPRAKAPFVPVNCGAIPGTLVESEFFGVVRGAFTGADRDRAGLFESASGGTLFLDEVGELPESVQVKLLRVLQEGVVRRLGSEREITVDVRVVAATNRDLDVEVREGRFREDLFYRLAVVTLRVPALGERPEDLALLADHLVARHARRLGIEDPQLAPEARAALLAHAWPGNVRELENVLERALILSEGGHIGLEVLPPAIRVLASEPDAGEPVGEPTEEREPEGSEGSGPEAPEPDPAEDLSVKRRGAELERELIVKALERTGGHRGRTAELLELSDRALRYKIREYGLDDD